MRRLPPLLTSPDQLEQGFADGLAAMLEKHQGLGVYILALANAAYDPALWTALAPALQARHTQLAGAMTQKLRSGEAIAQPEDDVMVFLKLMAIGFEHVQTVQSRQAGDWQLFYNPIRALRPPRMSGAGFNTLLRPFETNGFHFNKPFLSKEILWQGELAGKPARILYNKFPFARLHGLLVPEPEREQPQYLTPAMHSWAWDLCAQSDIPGFCVAYNSLGAGASVNHLHFQSFVAGMPLPLHSPAFSHNGGHISYPLPCLRFESMQEAWLWLDQLHQQSQPYNLIYSANALHVIARAPQGSENVSSRCQGWGWSEMAGLFNLFSLDEFTHLDATAIASELGSFATSPGNPSTPN